MIQGEREMRDNDREIDGWIDRDRGLGRRENCFI